MHPIGCWLFPKLQHFLSAFGINCRGGASRMNGAANGPFNGNMP
jgi:hypothetical protein